MNWLQKIAAQSRCNDQGECIVEACIYVNGKFFFGSHHGEALNKAFDVGALTLDEEGRIEGYPGPDIHLDLLRTNEGRIMNRFQSDEEFDFTGF